MIKKLICSCLFILFVFSSNSQNIERVEPPFWWVGMHNPALQLMVYGENIADLRPAVSAKFIDLKVVHKLSSPNYLFIDLVISREALPGDFMIKFYEGNEMVLEYNYTLLPRRDDSANRKGFDNSDVMYLVTPDRFANGNPSNDELEIYQEGKNREAEYGRHGGDIQGLSDHLDYIQDMGFTALWLNPILENDQPQWSYHGYATTDYYKVDERFGTNEEYVALSKKASQMGVKMIMDIIVNHCGSEHWWMQDPPSSDWINYYDQEYIQSNHRKITLVDPYVAPLDREHMVKGWFVPAMPDLNQENPYLSTYLIQNTIWWIEYADLAGIRQDTYSYPHRKFMSDWTCAIMDEYPLFNIVGEEWVEDAAIISYWQRGKSNHDGYTSCLPSLMDFPMTMNMHKALIEEEGWRTGLNRLYESLGNDYHYPEPDNLVIFPDNHDMSRIFTQVNEDYGLYQMALAYILTMRGIPQLYYGTEILMANPGSESHGIIRSDFPGGWAGDEINGFKEIGLTSAQLDAKKFIKGLLQWRKDKSVIHAGKLIHYIPQKSMYVFIRYDQDEIVITILNKNKEAKQLELDRFKEIISAKTKALNVITGEKFVLGNSLDVPAWSPMILELTN